MYTCRDGIRSAEIKVSKNKGTPLRITIKLVRQRKRSILRVKRIITNRSTLLFFKDFWKKKNLRNIPADTKKWSHRVSLLPNKMARCDFTNLNRK
jgi:hypothetical protein